MKIDGAEIGPSGGPRRVPWDLRLKTLSSSRATFARIVRGYANGLLDEGTYKNLAYGLGLFLAYLKTEREDTFEARLSALEDQSKGATYE